MYLSFRINGIDKKNCFMEIPNMEFSPTSHKSELLLSLIFGFLFLFRKWNSWWNIDCPIHNQYVPGDIDWFCFGQHNSRSVWYSYNSLPKFLCLQVVYFLTKSSPPGKSWVVEDYFASWNWCRVDYYKILISSMKFFSFNIQGRHCLISICLYFTSSLSSHRSRYQRRKRTNKMDSQFW